MTLLVLRYCYKSTGGHTLVKKGLAMMEFKSFRGIWMRGIEAIFYCNEF